MLILIRVSIRLAIMIFNRYNKLTLWLSLVVGSKPNGVGGNLTNTHANYVISYYVRRPQRWLRVLLNFLKLIQTHYLGK